MTFYVGIDFYLTDPKALEILIKEGHQLYIVNKSKTTYHPKLYYFKNNTEISAIIGSANLTSGGISDNLEISVLLETSEGSTIDKELLENISCYNQNSTLITTQLQISQYANDYYLYKQKIKKAEREFVNEKQSSHKIPIEKIEIFAKRYLKDEGELRFQAKTQDYVWIKNQLNKIAKSEIKDSREFLEIYESIAKTFHSSGLLRGKNTFAEKYKTIISIIKVIKQNKNIEPEKLFDKILPHIKDVKRFGVNAATEVMNTFNPTKYSVANGRTLKSLYDIGFEYFPNANDFNSDDYGRYNKLIHDIATIGKFQNLGQVDNFLSWYYSKYVAKSKNN